jgi:hypothetical protein
MARWPGVMLGHFVWQEGEVQVLHLAHRLC